MSESSQETGIQVKFLSSSDLGDLSLYDFLQWHISVCPHCAEHLNDAPPKWGVADNRHCQDYYDITQEYSDYERDYISRGNP